MSDNLQGCFNIHLKFKSDRAKTVVFIVPTKLHSWPWPCQQKSIGFFLSSSKFACKVWKCFGKNCSLYCAHKVSYTECQSWSWPLIPQPKINRGPPLIIHNLHSKLEGDWPKTVAFIVPIRFYTQSAKFESDLDLWPHVPKSKEYLLSSSTTYMWSFKVIGQTRGPKGHILWLWVQCAVFLRNRPRRTFLFTDRPRKQKLGRGRWDLASCQVSLNSIEWFQRRSRKCLSQSEAKAAIFFFQSARKTWTW